MKTKKQWLAGLGVAALGYAALYGSSGAAPSELKSVRTLPPTKLQKEITAAVESYYSFIKGNRSYLMLDKPLYQPGETIWFRVDFRQTADFLPAKSAYSGTVELLDPKGASISRKLVDLRSGVGSNDITLSSDAPGGEYTLKLSANGTSDKRTIIVASYEAPRLKKSLEFLRKSYGAGAAVSAALKVSRSTGEPFAKKMVTAVVIIDEQEVSRTKLSTDADGNAVVSFTLPDNIAIGDGLLTILAEDGGVIESIQRRIPILMQRVSFEMFPEGGDLINGLPGRVYFSAKNTLGKPADVEGRVLDNTGKELATLRSIRDGMGRFELSPEKGKTYTVELTKPEGISQKIQLPAAKDKGCTLLTQDDFDTKSSLLQATVSCTEAQTLVAEGLLRERHINAASFEVPAKTPSLLAFDVGRAQGALRLTLFDEKKNPVAERLVYRGRGQGMKLSIEPSKKTYAPRDKVSLTVSAKDQDDKPIEANVGLSVVDDAVLSFADDKTANLITHLFLERELPAVTIEDPNFYFSNKPEAAQALDLVMGTKGYRRFDWVPVLSEDADRDRIVDVNDKCPTDPENYNGFEDEDGCPDTGRVVVTAANIVILENSPGKKPTPAKPKEGAAKPPAVNTKPKEGAKLAAPKSPPKVDKPALAVKAGGKAKAKVPNAAEKLDPFEGGERANIDGDLDATGFSKVRVFPVPEYKEGYSGPRDDFRETIYWNPEVKTDKTGKATVSFFLSDAITSFKATVEGFSSAGLPGRAESIISSKLPLSLDVVLPLEVSEGDKLSLPVTLTNETDRELSATVKATFGKAFSLTNNPADKPITLKAGEKRAIFYSLTVVGKAGEGEIKLSSSADGLTDELSKKIKVVPLGFPFELSYSGTLKDKQRQELDLSAALKNTPDAVITLYPTPLASMVKGAEGILREPSGCFEQTSSSNYPNVMVMQYMQSNSVADPELWNKANGLMDRGYKKLIGYETKEKGYEWFGGTPAHEALTAYGLMEFVDMSRLDDNIDQKMIKRTADWLLSRRDGKGGFKRDAKALDSFGRASETTTNSYIVWALSEARQTKELQRELERITKVGNESKDPYIVGLAVRSLLNADPKSTDGAALAKKLAGMQDKDGSFPGAKESITMSGGVGLNIEATSVALLALLKASPSREYEPQIKSAVGWLNGSRDGWGQWGNTQGTILSLKALSAYTEYSKVTPYPGKVKLLINGKEVRKFSFEAGQREPIVFNNLGELLKNEKNTIELQLESKTQLPYSIAVSYRSDKPQTNAGAPVELETELTKKEIKMGESVRMKAHLVNTSGKGLSMTMIRLGTPGGLTFQTWQLKELVDKGAVGFYETREREVILYFRALAPDAKIDIDLDLIARTPGSFTGPASSAYLYYTNELKSWAPQTSITVTQ